MSLGACSAGAPASSAPAASSAAPASESAPAASSSGSPATAGVKAAALFPGLVDDQSWNQAGFEGLKKAESEAGATIAYTEKVTQDQQVETFRNYAQQGYNVIIGHGGEYMDSALQVASEFPELQFVVTNGSKSAANVTSLALSYGDMGYLSGVLACSVTKSNKIGVVTGETIPIVNDGYKGWQDGCKRVNPNAEVKMSVTGDWADVDKGREATLALIADGADVVGHIIDAADAGVFSAAEDKGVSAIGLYADQSKLGPKSHIGAATADPGLVVFKAVTEPLDGQIHFEGVKEGVVSFGAFASSVPQAAQDAVKAAEDDLKSGAATF
ncbi:MAG TPA: BMP family protein [Candidatus Limnocylindrales bacterium]|nr:BMP family protein [Candidatus Limnocylindrales bacterium]